MDCAFILLTMLPDITYDVNKYLIDDRTFPPTYPKRRFLPEIGSFTTHKFLSIIKTH